jgi:hypothetical protein
MLSWWRNYPHMSLCHVGFETVSLGFEEAANICHIGRVISIICRVFDTGYVVDISRLCIDMQ